MASYPSFFFHNMMVDILANRNKTAIHICVGVTQHAASNALQVSVSLCVLFSALLFIMLGSVQFYNNICRGNIKIYNIISQYFLTVNRHWQKF